MADEKDFPTNFYASNTDDDSAECPHCFYGKEGTTTTDKKSVPTNFYASETDDDSAECPHCFYGKEESEEDKTKA